MAFEIVSLLNPMAVTNNNTGVITITPGGNTAGATNAISSGSVMLAGGNNITLSQNGSTISIVGGAGGGGGSVNLSAGTTSQNLTNMVFSNSNGLAFGLNGSTITGSYTVPTQTNYVFSNSNGVSFGTNGSTVTATVATNYQSQGAYLTTARASNDAIGLNTAQSNATLTANSSGFSFDGRGYAGTNTSFGGTNVSGSITLNSNGLSLSMSAPAAGGGAGDGYNIIGVNGGATQLSSTYQLSNANNVSFGLNAGTITASASYSQSTQPAVAQINGSSGTLSFATGSSLSSSSNGSTITFGLASNITTALQSANANYLTSQSNQAFSASGGSTTFQTLNFANSNGVTFSNSNGSVIASHNGLTTAMASNRGTDFVQATAAFAGTNASGTIASNGISVSVNAGGGATPVASASNGSFSFTTLGFSNANNVTFGTSAGSIITASVAAPGAAAENNNMSLIGNVVGNSTASGSTIVLSGGNNVTLSGTNGSVIRIDAGGGGGAGTYANWEPFLAGNNTTFSSMGQNSLYLQKLLPDENFSFNNFELRMSGSFVSSSVSQVAAHTINYGLYSKNGASYSSLATSSMFINASYNSNTAMGYTISQGAGSFTSSSGGTAIASLMTGFKHLYLPFTSTITAGGQYAFGINISSATTVGTSPHRMALMNQTHINNLTVGKVYVSTILASNASFVGDFAMGVLSVTTGAMPSSVAESALTNQVSQGRLYMQLD